MPKTIALVSCVSSKLATPAPADELYVSDWFKKAAALAARIADAWYILSAEHALVDPADQIGPYNRTLNRMPKAERIAWAARVLQQLLPRLHPGDQVVMLAGAKYRENLIQPIRDAGCTVSVPMEGLRIGCQLRWLLVQLEKTHEN